MTRLSRDRAEKRRRDQEDRDSRLDKPTAPRRQLTKRERKLSPRNVEEYIDD